MSLACRTSWIWRHPCVLKGQNRIFSLCTSTLNGHFAMVIHWHRTLFLLFWGGAVLMEILSHLLFATNLRLFGFLCGLIFKKFFRDKRYILKYQFWITRYMTLEYRKSK